MITITEEIEIKRPVKEVYNYIANVENTLKWQPAVIEVKKLTDGPLVAGSKFREVARAMGRKINTTCEILELIPGEKISFGAVSDFAMKYHTTYKFETRNDHTLLNIVGTFELRGWMKILEFILKYELKKESRSDLKRMKQIIEEHRY